VGDARRAKLADLEEQLYGHVLDAIDFDALFQLEQLLWGLIDQRGIDDQDGELADSLIVDAINRAAHDDARHCTIAPPPGMTEAETRAARFDEACPFCRVEKERSAL
jgi:hypothetical protein